MDLSFVKDADGQWSASMDYTQRVGVELVRKERGWVKVYCGLGGKPAVMLRDYRNANANVVFEIDLPTEQTKVTIVSATEVTESAVVKA